MPIGCWQVITAVVQRQQRLIGLNDARRQDFLLVQFVMALTQKPQAGCKLCELLVLYRPRKLAGARQTHNPLGDGNLPAPCFTNGCFHAVGKFGDRLPADRGGAQEVVRYSLPILQKMDTVVGRTPVLSNNRTRRSTTAWNSSPRRNSKHRARTDWRGCTLGCCALGLPHPHQGVSSCFNCRYPSRNPGRSPR